MPDRYTAIDGHEASPEDRAILDYVNARWHGHYQLRLSLTDDGPEYHLCTKSACCQFSDLASLKDFLGEAKWRN